MTYIKDTAFEIYVSNSKRNDTQNITGKFGSFEGETFTPDICSAGFLCKRHSLLPSEGYEKPLYHETEWGTASKLKNSNSWHMVTAENGIDGFAGAHTGIYACDTHNVNSATMGDIDINLPGRTLGLPIRENERGNYVEMIAGEQYNFGNANFYILPTVSAPYCKIVNGLLAAQAEIPTDGCVFFELKAIGRFIEGNMDGGAKYTMLCRRAELDLTGVSVRAGTYDAATGTWTASAPYSVNYNSATKKYVVTGTIPYGPADAMFPTAGYRFAVKVKNSEITAQSQLPNGIICMASNTRGGGYFEYTKSAFETDGSLIAVCDPDVGTLATNREIKIKWDEDTGFSVYTFDLSGATLQPVYSITPTVTNGTYSGDTQILGGETASGAIIPTTGYELPSSISVVGATYTYDNTTGAISYSAPTADVTISATCPAEAPTPSLTPFSVNQVIAGVDFGNVSNGDTSSAMDTFLSGLTYSEGIASLVTANDESVPLAAGDLSVMSSGEVSGYVIMYAPSFAILYSTVAYASQGVSAGFQNLTDGKYSFGSSATVSSVNEAQGWNGVLIGAVEGDSGVIEVNDELNKLGFDLTATTATVNAFLTGLNYNDGFASLVECDNVGTAETGHDIVTAYSEDGSYMILVGTSVDGQSGDIDYSNGIVYNSESGWDTEVLTDGEITINITPTPVVSAVSNAEGWNGIIIRKVTE